MLVIWTKCPLWRQTFPVTANGSDIGEFHVAIRGFGRLSGLGVRPAELPRSGTAEKTVPAVVRNERSFASGKKRALRALIFVTMVRPARTAVYLENGLGRVNAEISLRCLKH